MDCRLVGWLDRNFPGYRKSFFILSAFIDTEELAIVGDGNMVASAMAITKMAALAYLMFILYTPPCFAALGAMNSEMQSKKWLWGDIVCIGCTSAGCCSTKECGNITESCKCHTSSN